VINDSNKGWDLLQEVLLIFSQSSDIGFELVVVGHSGEIVSNCPYKIHSVGEISDDEILIDIYSAVDLLVVPSRFEAFSQVTLEAQSCGLPVVGFNIGGIPDILIHKKTGWISATFDLIDFSKGINWILKEEGRSEKLGLNGRKNVIKKFSSERVSKQYYDLYQKVLTNI
jgi:glycosyltransferase involved in cell wall biosynthesis